MKKMSERYGLPIAVSAGNSAANNEFVNAWPSKFNEEGLALPGMMAVGASKQDGTEAEFSQEGWGVDVFAPGQSLQLGDGRIDGTSLGMSPSTRISLLFRPLLTSIPSQLHRRSPPWSRTYEPQASGPQTPQQCASSSRMCIHDP